MIVLSISNSKALASLPSKKVVAACLSSNAVDLSQPPVFPLLRQKFWAAFAARHELKSGPNQGLDLLRIHHLKLKEIVIPPMLSLPSADADAEARPPKTSICQRHLAREELFKNAHMKASSRFMKRGDGELSRGYAFLGIKAEIPRSHSSNHDLTNASSLAGDIAAAKSHREKMYQHFWGAHKRRNVNVKDASKMHLKQARGCRRLFEKMSAELLNLK